jgi:hypothetical protein
VKATIGSQIPVALLLPPRVACLRAPGKRRFLSRILLHRALSSLSGSYPHAILGYVADREKTTAFAYPRAHPSHHMYLLFPSHYLIVSSLHIPVLARRVRASNIASMRRPIVAAQPEAEASSATSISPGRRR